ncbi:MAG TPA: LysM peptidoglycan-binding domain-containing protein [Bacteroidetes bacterium]|nr:LysM peptidoglycan-binding domain-containing protein [Bacteroidota bacterium]
MSKMKTYTCTLFFTLAFFGFTISTQAQCPPANAGYHRVQKGESLWRISRKYNVSVDQICEWNGIQKTDVLSICQELAIRPPGGNTFTSHTSLPATPPEGRTDSSPAFSNMTKQEGTSHTIRQGETIAGLARLYGYTEARFREFNGLSDTEPAWPGLVLKTSDCNCPAPPDETSTVYTGDNYPSESNNSNNGNYERETFPTWEEAIATNDGEDKEKQKKSSFEEDPFYEGTFVNTTSYDKPQGRINIYNNDKNSRPAATNVFKNRTDINKKHSLDPKVRRSEHSNGAPARTYLTPEEQLIQKNKRYAPATNKPADNTNNKPATTGRPSVSKDAARYMKPEEIDMVNEINLVRSNPAGYVKYVEAYKKDVAAGKAFGSVATCDELIAELKRTPPLSVLQPTECIYNAAKNHGEDQRPTGETDHVGTDGSYPWDRVRKACPNMTDGNENLVGGPSSVRKSVLLLLVDDGIPNRGHRRTLLQKDWKYVACYKIGQVGRMPNSWVQNFGK